jgi:hypothetical protein
MAALRLSYSRCRMSSRMKDKTPLYILLLDATWIVRTQYDRCRSVCSQPNMDCSGLILKLAARHCRDGKIMFKIKIRKYFITHKTKLITCKSGDRQHENKIYRFMPLKFVSFHISRFYQGPLPFRDGPAHGIQTCIFFLYDESLFVDYKFIFKLR